MASRNLGAPNAYKKDIDAPGKHGGPSYQRRQRKWMGIAPTRSSAAPARKLVVEELPDDFCNKSTYRFHPTPSGPNRAIRVEQRIATKKAPMKGASPYPSQ